MVPGGHNSAGVLVEVVTTEVVVVLVAVADVTVGTVVAEVALVTVVVEVAVADVAVTVVPVVAEVAVALVTVIVEVDVVDVAVTVVPVVAEVAVALVTVESVVVDTVVVVLAVVVEVAVVVPVAPSQGIALNRIPSAMSEGRRVTYDISLLTPSQSPILKVVSPACCVYIAVKPYGLSCSSDSGGSGPSTMPSEARLFCNGMIMHFSS